LSGGNVVETTKLATHCTAAATDSAIARIRFGNISPRTNHTTGPPGQSEEHDGTTLPVRAITVVPGDSAGAKLSELPEPQPGPGDLLVEPVLLGVCGTDREIVDGVHGEAPEGADRLVLGHELLARVRTAPDGSGAREGDLVAGIVRWPDPESCACWAGRRPLWIPRIPLPHGNCDATLATDRVGTGRYQKVNGPERRNPGPLLESGRVRGTQTAEPARSCPG